MRSNQVSQAFIIGAGFAGLQAARSLLSESPTVHVTLIDRNPYATMIPALPDVLSGRVNRESLNRPLREILAGRERVSILTGTVNAVDLPTQTVTVDDRIHNYDFLTIATGSVPQYFGFVPEDGELHTVHTLDTARRFRDEYRARSARAGRPVPVVIVGAGYTGLEVAACLRHGTAVAGNGTSRIVVVDVADEILTFLSDKERRHVMTYLQDQSIDIRTGVSLTRYAGGTAILSDGTEVANALVCWAAGMRSDGFPVDGVTQRTPDGRLHTNQYLQLTDYPQVFVAGDAAAIKRDGRLQRRAVNFAWYSGRTAGRNLGRLISAGGNPDTAGLKPFRPVDLGWVIPLSGTSVGHVLGPLRVRGRLGLRMHYSMCGFRHFGISQAWEFFRTAGRLSRRPDPLGLQTGSGPGMGRDGGPA